MHAGVHDEITKALDKTPVNARDIIENMARRKSAFELARLRRAAEIADAGVQALHEDARPGLKEYELAAIVEHRMRSLGAEDNFGMVVANNHNQALHPPTDRVVQPGDIIIGEITPCIGGLFVQICRTMVLGEPPPVVHEKYAILKSGHGFGHGRGDNRRAGKRGGRGDQWDAGRSRVRKILPAAVYAGARAWLGLRLFGAGHDSTRFQNARASAPPTSCPRRRRIGHVTSTSIGPLPTTWYATCRPSGVGARLVSGSSAIASSRPLRPARRRRCRRGCRARGRWWLRCRDAGPGAPHRGGPGCRWRCSSILCSAWRSFAEPGSCVLVAGSSQAREEDRGGLRSAGAFGHAGDGGEHVEHAEPVAHVVVADKGSPQRGRSVGVATAGEEHETAEELGR